MRLLGLGDNTVDIYIDRRVQFPGGNAVNVAVFAKRLGFDASYLGCIGNDDHARLVESALAAEGVDLSHIKRLDEPNSWSRTKHRGNERVFDTSYRLTWDRCNLSDEDLDFIAGHDHCHSSVYSGLEADLPRIRQVARCLSFDFSDISTHEYIGRIAPYIDIAFVSGAKLTLEECSSLFALLGSSGCGTTIVTRGAAGALGTHRGEVASSKPANGTIKDTLGAGDGFIAGFVVAHHSGTAFSQSLQLGAEHAATVCAEDGAFGHGMPIGTEPTKTDPVSAA
ncbi:MAG: fructoselysine kinase [Hyphomicrobiales bacterium]|jgi:fructoselysine 6-kinase|nr:MAG: fructoselysine kinase [Hyphomicrobiales bacterium]